MKTVQYAPELKAAEPTRSRPNGTTAASLRTVGDLLEAIDRKPGELTTFSRAQTPTGFDPLDDCIGGGLHGGELALMAGAPGTGKTTMLLQWARNIAASGAGASLYINFEHDELELLCRVIAQESSPADGAAEGGLSIRDVNRIISAITRAELRSLASLAAADSRLARAVSRIREYGGRFCIQRASSRTHTVPAIEQLVDQALQRAGVPVVLFVDYLQRVPTEREFANDVDRIRHVAEGLKELALRRQICVVAAAALDDDGLKAQRPRVQHLWGSAALAYEADLVMLLADKADCVARVYFEFSPQKVETFREWVVLSLVKNRSGRPGADLEFRKQFGSARFDSIGGHVSEKLIDGRIFSG